MASRWFIAGSSKILLLTAVVFLLACNRVEKPNVVFILVDDLGWTDLGCYGSTFYDTPNLDKLASQSIRFTNAYAASPVCSPTRAAIMTGKYPARVNITDWIPGMSADRAENSLLDTPEDIHILPLEEITMAEVFKAHGYQTFFAGKWHLGESEEYWPLAQGFDVNKGGNYKGSPTFPGGKGYYSPYGNPTLEDGPDGEYLTDRLTDESIHFIESAGKEPFFLFLAYYTVHTPIQGCDAYDDLYFQKSMSLPDSGKMVTRREHLGSTRVNQSDPKYAAMVRSMDTNVGRVIKKLEEKGILDNTIIVFTSDNGGLTTMRTAGPTSVLPLRAGKGWCYEGGIRVPLLIRFPGIKHAGSECHQPAISMDFYPTLLDLAHMGLPADQHMDGKSLVPYLRDPVRSDDRMLVWHYPHYHGSTWRPGSAIRDNEWKLIEFYEDQAIELYNLKYDPGEKDDLSGELPEKADSLRRDMHQMLHEMGAGYPVRRDNLRQEKPNFVWIISEDNSKHYMELFDPNGIATPNIEKMAGDGILFTRAFSNAPVCSVARSTLISSCYGPRTGTQYHRKSKVVPMPEGIDMFPAYLRNAGYYTTNNSKEDYNYRKNDGVWDESSRSAHWRNREPGQSFFHKESHPVSHESRLHFKKELMATYKPVTDPDSVFVFPNHPDTELFRFTGAYYRDRILAVDTIVGDVMRQLDEDGLLETTFIFYFGDHGGVLPGSKGYLYESGLHIPLVVRIPEKFKHLVDFRRGAKTDGFVSFIDFGPTLLELAGVNIPEGMDGKPFLGKGISSKHLGDREVTFGYADRFDEKYDLVRTVRKGNYKYMRNYQPFNPDGLHNFYRYRCLAYKEWRDMFYAGELSGIQRHFFEPRGAEELYDLEADPYETKDLAADPAYQDILLELRTTLTKWAKGMPDLSFYPESELRKKAFENPVVFGQEQRQEIAELIDVADLSLLSFDEAREGIGRALSSGNPWKNYWGLIVCSCFGTEAEPFYETAKKFLKSENLLLRTRAAEFLGLVGVENPVGVISEALQETEDDMEATLILNSVVLLMDGPFRYQFDLDKNLLSSEVLKQDLVQRRLEYINMEH